MKITFTKDHMSVASGNSFYTAGTQADLLQGKVLIDLGVAREGWEPIKKQAVKVVTPAPPKKRQTRKRRAPKK